MSLKIISSFYFTYLFRANFQNATNFVGVAYPPNKISKTVLKMQAFYIFFEILLGSEQLQMQNIIQEFWIAEDLLKVVLLRPEPVLTVLLMYKTH